MGWKVYGRRLSTAELASGSSVFTPYKRNTDGILKAVRTWFILVNNPTFTSLFMKIYSNNGGVPGKLLATSTNVRTKAALLPNNNSRPVETWFEFDNFNMRGSDTYHFVPGANGYTDGWPTSGIAWRRGWPDPVYTQNVSITYTNIPVAPFALYTIGADL